MSVADYVSNQLFDIRAKLYKTLDLDTHEMIDSIFTLIDRFEALDEYILENVNE